MFLSEIKSRFPGCLTSNIVTVLTELFNQFMVLFWNFELELY